LLSKNDLSFVIQKVKLIVTKKPQVQLEAFYSTSLTT
jgi:hypothetical protein